MGVDQDHKRDAQQQADHRIRPERRDPQSQAADDNVAAQKSSCNFLRLTEPAIPAEQRLPRDEPGIDRHHGEKQHAAKKIEEVHKNQGDSWDGIRQH